MIPDYEPFIEWLLANPEITDTGLIQVLVASHYEKAYQRALERGASPQQAHPVASRALALAVYQRGQFGGAMPLDDWITQLVDRAAADLKLPPIIEPTRVEAKNAGETNLALAQSEVEWALTDLRKRDRKAVRVRRWVMAGVCAALLGLFLWLAGNNQIIQALNQDSQSQFDFPYVTQPGDTLNSIARLTGVTVAELHPEPGIEPGDPLEPGVTYWIPAHPSIRWEGLLPRLPVLQPATLTLTSAPAEIRQRILNSPRYWQTLWDDELTLVYGPAGYVAPPVVALRQQVWLRQPGQGLLLMGSLDGATYSGSVYFDGNRIFTKNESGMIAITRFITGSMQAEMQNYQLLAFVPQSLSYHWNVKTVGMESLAGRSALVVDWYDDQGLRKGRWWVDARLGVILAQRIYAPAGNGTERQPVLEDRIVLAVQTGMAIPESVLNPGNDLLALASDAAGLPLEKHEIARPPKLVYAPNPAAAILVRGSPPSGFDPNQSFLSLRPKPLPGDDPFEPVSPLPSESLNGSRDRQGLRSIDVFGDGYYLGTFTLPSPGNWHLSSCSRSPDGSVVVFDLAGTIPSLNLDWFRVSQPGEIYTLPPTWTSYSGAGYAFSPSSQQLAFHGCGWEGSIACGIALLSFDTGQTTLFANLKDEGVLWLGWSPNGDSLAAVTTSGFTGSGDSLKVFQTSSGQLTYRGPFNLKDLQAAPNAPTRAWEQAYKPASNPEMGCALP